MKPGVNWMPAATLPNYPFTGSPKCCGREQSSRKRVVISRLKSSRPAEDDGKKNRANLLGGPRLSFFGIYHPTTLVQRDKPRHSSCPGIQLFFRPRRIFGWRQRRRLYNVVCIRHVRECTRTDKERFLDVTSILRTFCMGVTLSFSC